MAVKASASISLTRVNDGATGPAGKGIKSTAITYQASTSGTIAPTGTWNTSVPSVPQGQYLWSRTVITYTDNSTSTTYSVAYIPKNGQNGATGGTGATGTGVASIVQQYYISTTKTSQTGGAWVTSMPTWSSGKYLWTRYQINYKNPTSTSYTSPVCDSSWEAVNEVQVGGRNYINKSDITYEITNKSSPYVGTIHVSENLDINDLLLYPFTLSFYVKTPGSHKSIGSGGTNTRFGMHGSAIFKYSNGTTQTVYPFILFSNFDKEGRVSITQRLSLPDGAVSISSFSLSIQLTEAPADDNDKTWIFSHPKFELGNRATDWTPAPEDIDESIGNAQDTADNALSNSNAAISRLNVAELTIDAINKSISSLVTDENGGSLMTQGPDGWTFNISSIQKNVENAVNQLNSLTGKVDGVDQALDNINSLANDLSKKTAYINMTTDENGSPCIELGKQDNEFKVRITNTSIDFIQGVTKVAYFNNHSLYIRKSIINDELQIGEKMGFIWKRRGNGNMGLRWIGG